VIRLLLATAARWFALFGAFLALVVAVMVVYSIVGRAWLYRPLLGDVEITQMGIAASISLCLPWCQLHRGNIIVDFFTQNAPATVVRWLDGFGAALISAMGLLLAWRACLGATSVMSANEQTMILGLPMWWTYASLVPGLLLASLVALCQAVLGPQALLDLDRGPG
jgi:TRAP-type C4-dicarboxylate transport system permease small subunit